MWRYIKLRAPVLFAFIFCLAAFILSLLVLLAGTGPSSLPNAWIVMYDPSKISHTTKATPDWYAFYYLSICHGNSTSTTITCSRQVPGYQISIARWVHPAIARSGSDAFTLRSRTPGVYVAVLIIGIILNGIGLLLLPWLLRGRHHFNGYILLLLLVAMLDLLLSTIFATVDASQSRDIPGTIFPSTLLAMEWVAVICLIFACVAEWIEWRLQVFTPLGERVNRNWKPAEKPWWSSRPTYIFRSGGLR